MAIVLPSLWHSCLTLILHGQSLITEVYSTSRLDQEKEINKQYIYLFVLFFMLEHAYSWLCTWDGDKLYLQFSLVPPVVTVKFGDDLF